MLKKYSQLLLSIFVLFDAAVACASWGAAYYLRFCVPIVPLDPLKGAPQLRYYVAVLPVVALVCGLTYWRMGLYTPRRERMLLRETIDVGLANICAVVVLVALGFFYRDKSYSRLVVGIFAIVNSVLCSGSRYAVRSALRKARRRGWNVRRVLVVGSGRLGQELVFRISRNKWTGFKTMGYIDDDPNRVGQTFGGATVLGRIEDLPAIVQTYTVDQLFIALPLTEYGELRDIMDAVAEETVDVRLVPDILGFVTLNAQVGDFDGLPVLSLRETPLHGWNAILKRLVDVCVSLLLLTPVGLMSVFIAILNRRLSPGPTFYTQERMGLDGELFQMYKFRTMKVGAERATGPVWTTEDDPRRTKLGAVLREYNLDELPQLLNVLRGEMSLVGPRPERPEFIDQFRKSVPKYMLRHKMKAGMTGWAQVNGWRGDTSLEKRIQYDLYYIENWSVWFDFWIPH